MEGNLPYYFRREGRLSYLVFLENDQQVNQGDQLFSVIPFAGKIYAQAHIPILESGKIRPGQEVNIRLDNYPHQEFGMVKGKLTSVSALPFNGSYLGRIEVPDDLKSSYKRNLPFKQQLQGETEIITEDFRLAERIFYQLKGLLQN